MRHTKTDYKGLQETEVRPGEWMAISGVGGLGQVAIQHAKAMGLHVVAIDVGRKLDLARRLSADVVVDCGRDDPLAAVRRATAGGVRGALATAVSVQAFRQALGMVRRKRTVISSGRDARGRSTRRAAMACPRNQGLPCDITAGHASSSRSRPTMGEGSNAWKSSPGILTLRSMTPRCFSGMALALLTLASCCLSAGP